MRSPLSTLLDGWPRLLEVQPEWAWYVARAWRALGEGEAPPGRLSPWLALEALRDGVPSAERLGAALDAAAALCPAPTSRDALLWHAGHLLPASWAVALDELQTAGAQAYGANPAFVALARADPPRAASRVEQAMRSGLASRGAANLLYAALVACVDAGVPIPAALADGRARMEAADRFLVDEPERYEGRLRLAARGDVEAAARLAEEAVREAGADEVHLGVWAVMARHPRPGELALRLVEVAPRSPTPEVLLSLEARAGTARASEVEARARRVAGALLDGSLDGRRGWAAGWRLLQAAVAVDAPGAIGALLGLGPPRWAVELATWRELRSAPAQLERIVRYQAGPDVDAGVLESPPPPPWAGLPADVFAARLAVLADPVASIPSGRSWGAGPP